MKYIGITTFCLALLASTGANAHAFLERADPPVGSTTQGTPSELRLWFSEPLEAAFSSVEVADADGRRVETLRPVVEAADKLLLRVPLAKLAPGRYTVVWRAVSVDTHVSSGRFVFSVAP